jgi:hypothetical protein
VKRVIVLSSLITSAVWVTFTALAVLVAFPVIADAQATRVRAEQVTVVGVDGKELVRLGVPPAPATNYACVQLLGVEGTIRASMCNGGNSNPVAAGVMVYNQAGSRIARMGTSSVGAGGGTTSPQPELILQDSQARNRFVARLGEDENAFIQILDADGNVVWSAP